jgi:hypothetical protein
MELLDSGMVDEFLGSLKRIWLLGFGIAALNWYKAFLVFEAKTEVEVAAAIGLVVGLCRIGSSGGRDMTLIALIGSKRGASAAGIAGAARVSHLEGVDSYFAASLLQGRTINAWRVFGEQRCVEEVARMKHGDAGMECLDLLRNYPALLVGALALPKGELARRLSVPLPGTLSEVEKSLPEWEANLGRRSRRSFTIPHQCLYFVTERGGTTVYDSADSKLRGSVERPGKLWGSVYWDMVAEEFGGWEGIRGDCEKREAFYAAHFPDDIPDEWSLAERAKSHGCGSLQRGAAPSVKKFLCSWFGLIDSAVVWDPWRDMCEEVALTEEVFTKVGGDSIGDAKLDVFKPRIKVVLVV